MNFADEIQDINISTLIQFFANPCRQFLKMMHLNLENYQSEISDDEIFNPDGLENYLVLKDILDISLKDMTYAKSPVKVYSYLRGRGNIPHENPGKTYIDLKTREMGEYIAYINNHIDKLEKKNISEIIALENINISIDVNLLMREEDLLFFRPTSIKPSDYLYAWIYHVILTALGYKNIKTNIMGLKDGRIEHVIFKSIENPREIIKIFLKYFMSGLKKPLPLFLNTSHQYVLTLLEADNTDAALKKAEKIWKGDEFNGSPGEKNNVSIMKCFSGQKLMDIQRFQDVSCDILKPMMENIEVVVAE
jgi:exonuclease V gamma subunit